MGLPYSLCFLHCCHINQYAAEDMCPYSFPARLLCFVMRCHLASSQGNFLTSTLRLVWITRSVSFSFFYIHVSFLLGYSHKFSKFVFLPQGFDTIKVLDQSMFEVLSCKLTTLLPYFKDLSAATFILVSKKLKVKFSVAN